MAVNNISENFKFSGDVTIVHISDTHNRHDEITHHLPHADLLIHTGDFSNDGTDEEYQKFDAWLGKIKDRYKYGVVIVLGNHDFKFLDKLSNDQYLVETMADDEKRKAYMQKKLQNAVILDNEIKIIKLRDDLELSLYGSPWNPFQSSPTYPDKIKGKGKTDHDLVFALWSQNVPQERKNKWNAGQAWRYDEIVKSDILLTHVPPFGVFDQQPLFSNWGSSLPLLQVVKQVQPTAHLFGHVHAQRGYWEKIKEEKEGKEGKIVGGVQYAGKTNEEEIEDLMGGKIEGREVTGEREGERKGVQFLANSALMSDRTVQPFAKNKIVGPPRCISGTWKEGEWIFHDVKS
eukprot:CAMPEP_0201510462 /NCGR_PEP_ID=MMETSP0161_2-20130828/3128_1 /ASSEMBLY_ACC=CAM_ASM_000251 /TAXON_ID=180227 /ORGANISM="Neoparamoeba aestuarina, Strain SoJaBio B1-5/56/2" /LENGTH=345 /DNA_ID=CAMNT_0047905635 /DNA_START=134 /DNA_END=1171 /DNA_ORIENTATION=-